MAISKTDGKKLNSLIKEYGFISVLDALIEEFADQGEGETDQQIVDVLEKTLKKVEKIEESREEEPEVEEDDEDLDDEEDELDEEEDEEEDD